MAKKISRVALPGDTLAVLEEYLPGKYAYEDSGSVRALLAGKVRADPVKREISIEPASAAQVFDSGDWVTGQVEVMQTNSASVRIYYRNGKPDNRGFSGTLSFRGEPSGRSDRRRTFVKLGDMARAQVGSTLNGIIQLSLNDDHSGVIAASCSNCGRTLARSGSNRAKCDECGNVEERKFADDFGELTLQP